MSVNKAIVIGNLGRDPELRALPSGQNVVNLSIATKERFIDRNGERQERTEWHRVVAFGKLAGSGTRRLRLPSRRQLQPAALSSLRQPDGGGSAARTPFKSSEGRMEGKGRWLWCRSPMEGIVAEISGP